MTFDTPNGAGDPAWRALTETTNVRINFTLQTAKTRTDFRTTECSFWSSAYDTEFGNGRLPANSGHLACQVDYIAA